MSGFEIIGPEQSMKLPAIPGATGEDLGIRGGLGEKSEGFLGHLTEALEGVQGLSDDVKDKANALARGEPVELHDLMISMGKGEVAFNLMLEVRNKLLEAWQVLSRAV